MASTGTTNQYINFTDTASVAAFSFDAYTLAAGTSGGVTYVFAWSDDYDDDSGTAITAYWRSKDMDFTETYPQLQGQAKTIDKIRLWYEDTEEDVPITIYLSNNGGLAWDDVEHTIGDGDGLTKVRDYHFMNSTSSTGLNFSVKVECTSKTKRFQWTALEIDFFVRGKDFEA